MLLHAHEKGHPVSVFTTAVGMSLEDVEILKDIPFSGGSNGNFTLHLPDVDKRAKHPINSKYIEVVKKIKESNFTNLDPMSMGRLHPDFRDIFPEHEVLVPGLWNRAGNLDKEAMLRPEILADCSLIQKAEKSKKCRTCGCKEGLYHNVLLPNGDVSLCCMDYNLEEIIGNLFTQTYEKIIPNPNQTFDLCKGCENAITPPPAMNTLQILLEKFIKEPEDNLNKFWLGYEYEKMGHTSSAMGFYLACAENADDDLLAYESLLRKSFCFRTQTNRDIHRKNSLLLAISLLPDRPEAYYLLSQLYETSQDARDEDKWQQSYLWASMGENISKNFCGPSLLTDVEYSGDYLFPFQKAVSGWWIGRFSESLNLFLELSEKKGLDPHIQECVQYNLTTLKEKSLTINT